MKITVLTENLRKGLGIVIRAVSSKPQLPVLSGIMIQANSEGLELKSTDLEMSLVVKVGAKVTEEGELVVPARLFWELVNGLPVGPVELVSEKQSLKVVGSGVKTEIVGQAAEDFPSLVRAKGKGWQFPADELCKKLERVVVSAAKDDTRPVLSGILWSFDDSGLSLVATDGYRLGLEVLGSVEGEKEGKMILPARALSEWARIVADAGESKVMVEFDKENQQAIFSVGGVEMISRLIAGEFPPYGQIIPSSYKTKATLRRQEFLEAIKRSSLFARENANVVRLEFEDGKIRVKAESTQVGTSETEWETEIEGENVKMAFNARYLIEYLNSISDEELTMETEGELKPGVFRLMTDKFLQLVMPIRV